MMLARQQADAPKRKLSSGLVLPPTGAIPRAECDPEIQNCGGGGGGTPPPPPSGGNTAYKTHVDRFLLEQSMEGILMGTNEVEVLGKVNGAYSGCASATTLYADIEYPWGSSAGYRAATAIPIGTNRFTLRAFEDDDDRCVERDSDDALGNFATGLLITQYNFGWWTDAPGLAWMVIGAYP
jgi:hypothetical protein